jgi:hypothetical protein
MTATVPAVAPLYRIDDAGQRVTVVGVFSRADAYRPR